MTPAGFPHSDTLGSQLGWQLPEAYRSLLRPSSAPGAKASTLRPYYPGPKDARVTCAVLKVRAVPIANPTACHLLRRCGTANDRSCPVAKRRTGQTGRRFPGLSKRTVSPQRPFPQDPTTCPAGPTVTGTVPASTQ